MYEKIVLSTHCCWAMRALRLLPVSRGGRATGVRARSTNCSSSAFGYARKCSFRVSGSTSFSTVGSCGDCDNDSSSCSTWKRK